jgi:predicted phage terminase large subunit-like protein
VQAAPYLLTGVEPAELDRALVAKGGLSAFVQLSWGQVEPATLAWSWHMDLVCKHLAAVSRGECRELVINIPPGMSKSLLTCVFWPAWDWIDHPGRKWMFTSFDGQLSLRDAARCKDLVMSRWFQERWGFLADPRDLARWGLKPVGIIGANNDKLSGRKKATRRRKLTTRSDYDEIREANEAAGASDAAENHSARADSSSEYYTTSLGLRFSTFFGGKATGWHADIQVCDDPTKPRDVQDGGDRARKALERTEKTWKGTYSNRTANKKTFARVVIMQRLHTRDLAGICIAAGYTTVILPTEFDPARACKTAWGQDPRTERGELLCPLRVGPEEVAKMKATGYSPRDYVAQEQQAPNPEDGAIFLRSWYALRWTSIPAGARFFLSVDCAFKDEQGSDYVVIQVWARAGANYYLCDQARGHWDILATCHKIKAVCARWPKVKTKLVEDKANGSAVLQMLRKQVPGLVAIEPEGGKIARANAVEWLHRGGNVWLPANDFTDADEENCVEQWIEEHVAFPRGQHDDSVDTGTQALNYGEGKTGRGRRLAAAMDDLEL